MRTRCAASIALAAVLSLGSLACATADRSSTNGTEPTTTYGGTGDDLAVWTIATDANIAATSRSFTARVSRLNCNDGATGTVLEPTVELGPSSIVVTFMVNAIPSGTHTCPLNDEVAYLVTLDEPIGQRELVDGACLTDPASTTSFCEEGATRWRP